MNTIDTPDDHGSMPGRRQARHPLAARLTSIALLQALVAQALLAWPSYLSAQNGGGGGEGAAECAAPKNSAGDSSEEEDSELDDGQDDPDAEPSDGIDAGAVEAGDT